MFISIMYEFVNEPNPFPPKPRTAQALGPVREWSVLDVGVGPLRAKQRKRLLNVRHVVHGALNHR